MGLRNIKGLRDLRRSFLSGGGGIPFPTEALFTLDGTIIEETGSYYFADKTENARNFLITDYDWSDRNIEGLPYKSAATISAPVGDTELIAADVNNFLYDSGGNPNEIPVVSLFQNIDYENKLFCKHSGQVLDVITGVENQEAYVKDITLYATVKSGNELDTCNAYYVVSEEELINCIWVSKDGSDITGNGTKLKPYLTLAKGDSEMNSSGGDTLYVKTGIYKENDPSSGNWYPRYQGEYRGLGFVSVQGTATRVITPTLNGLGNFRNFIFDAEFSLPTIARALSGEVKYYSCFFTNYTGSFMIDNSGLLTSNFESCVFNPTSGTVLLNRPDGECSGCLFTGNGTYSIYLNAGNLNNYTIKHNIFSGTYTYSLFYGSGYKSMVFNNLFNSSATSWLLNTQSSYLSETTDITHNEVNGHTSGISFNINTNEAELVRFNNNYGIINDLQGNYFLSIANTNCEINNNSFDLLKAGNGFATRVISTGDSFNTEISNNKFIVKSNGGYTILVGSETTHAGDNLISATIENNLIISDLFTTNGCHNILVGFEKDFIIRYNKVINGGLAIIGKADGDISTSSIIGYNLLENCKQGIRLKGSKGVNVWNNTIYSNNSDSAYYGIYVDRNNNTSDNANIKNNILNINSTSGYCLLIDDSTFNSNFDCIYSETLIDPIRVGSINYTFLEFQTLLYELNGINQNPLLADLIPDSNSPTIGIGEDLGNDYRLGLDSSTDWGNDTQTPDVVTKYQGNNWDIGAYVNENASYTVLVDDENTPLEDDTDNILIE